MANPNGKEAQLEAARAGVYRFFSALLLSRPTPELLDEILSEEGASALGTLFPGEKAAARFKELVEDFRRGAMPAQDFLLDYEAMFRVPGSSYIHPFESVYRDEGFAAGDAKRAMVYSEWTRNVACAYLAEGMGLRESSTELEDHIGVELEFMSFLCTKRAEALESGDEAGARAFRAKQRTFLEEHLLAWSRECLRKMREHAATPLYHIMAGLLDSYLKEEGSWVSSN